MDSVGLKTENMKLGRDRGDNGREGIRNRFNQNISALFEISNNKQKKITKRHLQLDDPATSVIPGAHQCQGQPKM